MTSAELKFVPYRHARHQVRDSDLLLFRRRGLISIAGRGDLSHAAKAAWWSDDLLFLEGFNSAVLQNNDPIWAVAVPVTIRYEGDAQPGMPIRGHAFPCDGPAIDVTDRQGNPLAAGSDALAAGREPAQAGASADPLQANHIQGFGQSPQRSR
jgi:hypothetical protein